MMIRRHIPFVHQEQGLPDSLPITQGLLGFWLMGNRFSSVDQSLSLTAPASNPLNTYGDDGPNGGKSIHFNGGAAPKGQYVPSAAASAADLLDGSFPGAGGVFETGITLMAWVYPTDTPAIFNGRCYMATGTRTGSGGWAFGNGVASGVGGGLVPAFRYSGSFSSIPSSGGTVVLNQWNFICFTWFPELAGELLYPAYWYLNSDTPILASGSPADGTPIPTSANNFYFGSDSTGGGANNSLVGRLGPCAIWNRGLPQQDITQLLAGWTPGSQLSDDIIANWKGEDANDSARLYHLTEVNTPTYTSGLIDNAITLDRSAGERLTRANASAPTVTDADFSFAVAFKPASAPGPFEYQAIISTFDTGFANGWGLIFGGAGFGGTLRLAGYTTVPTETTIDCVVDEWNYAIIRYNTTNNSIKLRLINSNGDQTITNLAGPNTSVTDLNIGDIADSGMNFDGQLDELVLWDKEITDIEEQAWLDAVQAGKTAPYLS